MSRPVNKKLKPGINLIGYTRAEMGIGESCRIAAKIIETAKIPFGMINFEEGNPARMNDCSWSHKEISGPVYNINLIVINAAHYMKRLTSDAGYCKTVALRGQQTVLTEFSPANIGKLVSARLKRLGLLVRQ